MMVAKLRVIIVIFGLNCVSYQSPCLSTFYVSSHLTPISHKDRRYYSHFVVGELGAQKDEVTLTMIK